MPYLVVLTKVKNNLLENSLALATPFTMFHRNQACSFYIILLSNRQTEQKKWFHWRTKRKHLLFCDTSGPRPEGSLGGPSGVGEGHSALAVCPAGPGKTVPLASPEYRLQQPRSALRGAASQGDPAQLHGIWSTGKRQSTSWCSFSELSAFKNT